MKLTSLLEQLDRYLAVSTWPDPGVNGLQVEGGKDVNHVATGVSASVAFIDQAIRMGADTLMVHHGLLWEKSDPVIRGPLRQRLQLLLQHDLSLLAYHLPLDGHPVLGNNAQIAKKLGFTDVEPAFPYHGSPPIGLICQTEDLPIHELIRRLEDLFGSPQIHLAEGPELVNRVGIVSGGAQSEFPEALVNGCDAFITGEISEYVVDLARESKTHFFSCGHYRTETLGIQALGDYVAEKFGLTVSFISLPHPY
ncbi:MAG TPA: Nif3-like dinuclear metal center hexameric protein [Thermoanaerobaculia bacterium]|nr:Nif3-like dinuclear metal center hexameric protein [Thermoanaerobaculia bacterium]HUM28586.1 Nif3-like dinuclear metal center hexameric protein [Thermoanaerobaculia bacterium]HXK66806.1 Nif3-like dinuclear metal center hexameric protein [Thermoanaerobaculia bacterium]